MTKEELEQKAYEYAIKEIPFIECITQNDLEILVQQAYITGAEPREKRIAELKKANAELKKQLEMSNKVYNDNLDYSHHIEGQLTKAKDHIKKLLGCLQQDTNDPQTNYYVVKYMTEAEQFISEVEK